MALCFSLNCMRACPADWYATFCKMSARVTFFIFRLTIIGTTGVCPIAVNLCLLACAIFSTIGAIGPFHSTDERSFIFGMASKPESCAFFEVFASSVSFIWASLLRE